MLRLNPAKITTTVAMVALVITKMKIFISSTDKIASKKSVIISEHTLQYFEITTEDVLKNKSSGPDDIYPKILKETKHKIISALTSLP